MFSNLQINRTLVKKDVRMEQFGKTVSEEALQREWLEIQAAQADRAQFRPLYERYFESIFRFLYRRTGEEPLAADLCSQVFLKAMQKLDGYEFKGVPFSAWLYRIASNEVAQYYRRNKRNRVVSADERDFSDLAHKMEEDNTEQYLQALIGSLDELRKQDIELIELRFFEHRPFKEIAEILDITESNAKVRTYRILDRLKKKIQDKT